MCLIYRIDLHIMVCRRASMWTHIYTKHAQITSSLPYNPLINLCTVSWNILKCLKHKTIFHCSIFHLSCYYDGLCSRRIRIRGNLGSKMGLIRKRANNKFVSWNSRTNRISIKWVNHNGWIDIFVIKENYFFCSYFWHISLCFYSNFKQENPFDAEFNSASNEYP